MFDRCCFGIRTPAQDPDGMAQKSVCTPSPSPSSPKPKSGGEIQIFREERRPRPFAAHRGANAGPFNHPGHRSLRTGERTRPQYSQDRTLALSMRTPGILVRLAPQNPAPIWPARQHMPSSICNYAYRKSGASTVAGNFHTLVPAIAALTDCSSRSAISAMLPSSTMNGGASKTWSPNFPSTVPPPG